jgi:hypothetical protein
MRQDSWLVVLEKVSLLDFLSFALLFRGKQQQQQHTGMYNAGSTREANEDKRQKSDVDEEEEEVGE